ncbi:hypothetical protein KC19_5G081100 [Ceratodon purpureus]|uniref:Uncharacterized protein n=1 Tax=Ceratodon purpureus TaxID=3225 RepID=A0A8T0HZ33_CERPU|nr:hypothetical protein KC19_5G081100 [Ceratodon purpureus]
MSHATSMTLLSFELRAVHAVAQMNIWSGFCNSRSGKLSNGGSLTWINFEVRASWTPSI